MGIYSDYLGQNLSFQDLTAERKKQLQTISKLREGSDILVYAADINNKHKAPIVIDNSDLLPIQDQISNLSGDSLDIILETPGGLAEAVEDIVKLLRGKYNHIGVIVPGMAKSAGTIFTMAGDEILMGPASALGPIDAQIITNNKRFSADAFLEGLEKIKADVLQAGKLNPAYIPILQNISPGEIQHCENAQNFSNVLVTDWLTNFKFKHWSTHSSSGLAVTQVEKEAKAKSIADKLCKHSDWLTHGRSIKIPELKAMGLQITDYSQFSDLNEVITRYYTLLRMTFDSTNLYKIIETPTTQVQRFGVVNTPSPIPPNPNNKTPSEGVLGVECTNCGSKYEIQIRLDPAVKVDPKKLQYPKADNFECPNCRTINNLAPARLQIEAQSGKKIIS